MASTNTSTLINWVPYKLYFTNDEPYCKWMYLNGHRFTEPFFDDTIMHCRNYNLHNEASVSSIDAMQAWSNQMEVLRPAAVIFHVSRCGSTLLSQQLSLSPRNVVLSEVPFLDEILRVPYKHGNNVIDSDAAYQGALNFYAQKRLPNAENLFVKTDSWHLCFYQQLRNIYAGVPFIFLFRHPAEIIRSQTKRRGMQAVPGIIEPEIFGFNRHRVTQLNFDVYMAEVLTRYYELMISIARADQQVLLVNYNEGFEHIINKVLHFSGIQVSEEELLAMKHRGIYHGKYPGELFAEESALPTDMINITESLNLYHQLDGLRREQSYMC